MRYIALVKGLDPHIEEEVTLEVQGIEFTGFAFICPYEIEVGKEYPVTIGFMILDGLEIREICNSKKELKRIGTSYNYYIRGILNEDSIDAGIVISDDDEYFANYPDLIGKAVEFQVDRISVEFLKI
ncbi:hypothetical protein ACFSVM_00760 [Paenibacillus shunpengii]|uniref:Uncharacterized protein n=1 Tax=Paenibacillus shunpengii TaxID=2054424 RepID=A0ABW5SH00_9BACL|nr:hypothetical protein [Paenibacillus sp. FSL H7-0326]OMC72288.1 hypothetical protein BK126_09925 [Paenibacillus sp. FSL H7-0326]